MITSASLLGEVGRDKEEKAQARGKFICLDSGEAEARQGPRQGTICSPNKSPNTTVPTGKRKEAIVLKRLEQAKRCQRERLQDYAGSNGSYSRLTEGVVERKSRKGKILAEKKNMEQGELRGHPRKRGGKKTRGRTQ